MSTNTTKSSATTLLLAEDYDLFFFPSCIPINVTSLRESLSAYGSGWLDLEQIDIFEKEFSLFSYEILARHSELHQTSPFLSTTTNQTGVVESNKKWSNWIPSYFKRGDNNNTNPDFKTTSSTSSISYVEKTQIPLQMRKDFDSIHLSSEIAILTKALRLLKKWIILCKTLESRKRFVLVTKIFTCTWKSGFDAKDYSSTCIRYHTIMFSILCASLSFNLGRKCELMERNDYKEYYCQAFRLLYQIAQQEIDQWTTIDLNISTAPECYTDSCVLLMRLCLMKLQHSAIRTYSSTNILISTDPQDTFRTWPIQMICKEYKRAGILARLSMHLVAQSESEFPSERNLYHFEFPTCVLPPYQQQQLPHIGKLSLRDTFTYLGLFARIHLWFSVSLYYELKFESNDESDNDDNDNNNDDDDNKNNNEKISMFYDQLINDEGPSLIQYFGKRNAFMTSYYEKTWIPFMIKRKEQYVKTAWSSTFMTDRRSSLSRDNNGNEEENNNEKQQQQQSKNEDDNSQEKRNRQQQQQPPNVLLDLVTDIGQPTFFISDRTKLSLQLFKTPALNTSSSIRLFLLDK